MSCSERNSCKFSLFSSRDRKLPQLLESGTEPSSIYSSYRPMSLPASFSGGGFD